MYNKRNYRGMVEKREKHVRKNILNLLSRNSENNGFRNLKCSQSMCISNIIRNNIKKKKK